MIDKALVKVATNAPTDPCPAVVANTTMLYPGTPWWRAPGLAATDGFTSIEMWWPFDGPTATDNQISRLADAVHSVDITLVALNLFGGDLAAGERGILVDPARVHEVEDNVLCAVEIDRLTGTCLHNVLYGHPPRHASGDDELALRNLRLISDTLDQVGATALLEPLSGSAEYPIRTAAAAATVIRQIGHRPNGNTRIGMLADLYHLAATGHDLDATLRKHIELIRHVQVADWPGRGAPGTGSLDIATHLQVLQELGYGGLVAWEYVPQ